MRDRTARAAVAAALQLLASYLQHDLRALRSGQRLDDEPERPDRLEELRKLAEATRRGAQPVYARREHRTRGGSLTPERTEALASLDTDQELYRLVRRVRGEESAAIAEFAAQLEEVAALLQDSGWEALTPEQREFVGGELEQFLRRLGRLDELPNIRGRGRVPATGG